MDSYGDAPVNEEVGPAERKGKRASDLSGGSISAENIKDNYNQYWSFFRKPKEIESADQVPDFVDTFYNHITDIYEWGWGPSFHFSPSIPGKSDKEATRRIHEEMAVDLIKVKLGQKILDSGCGVKATCHAPKLEEVYAEIYRVMNAGGYTFSCSVFGQSREKPARMFDCLYLSDLQTAARTNTFCRVAPVKQLKSGSLYVSYEWVTTDKYMDDDQEHKEVIQGIERGDALPGLRSYLDISATVKRKPCCGCGSLSIDVAPKGTVDVHEMLFKTADYLTRGGETGIFTPMHMILCRKPDKASE
ncbi:hypothetical protein Bca101_027845 [Brassica carinata]